MDSEDLKRAVDEVSSAAREAAAAARASTQAAQLATEAAHAATAGLNEMRSLALAHHEETRRAIATTNRNFGLLWRHVHGSEPPPPTDGGAMDAEAYQHPSVPPLERIAHEAHARASSSSLELAALEGRVIAGFASLRGEVMGELRRQSSAMAIGAQGVRWLFTTREGFKILAMVVTTVTATYAAVRSHDKERPERAPQVVVVAPSSPSASADVGAARPH